jgi:hypothetical protein
MAEDPTIEKILDEVLKPHFEQIRAEVSKRLAEELETARNGAAAEAPASSGASSADTSAMLNSSMLSVQGSTSQTEILGALLDGTARFAARVALFVVKAGSASGWQGRGFEDDAALKRVSRDPNQGLAGRAMGDKEAASAAAAEFSSDLVRAVGNPGDGNCVVVPLVVRDKVPALLYADGGRERGGKLDSSGVELIVRTTGNWLEILSARKSGAGAGAEHEVHAAPPEPPKPAAPASPVGSSTQRITPLPEPAAAPPPPAPAPAPAAAPAVAIAPGDEELHKKAKRFAKLLVDEIKLYNQAKVTEGRAHNDLYDRLKDDIDKSRAMYDKRYATTSVAEAKYFDQELVRILAENDIGKFGANFPH